LVESQHYEALVKLTHVVDPVEFTYRRVDVDEPSVRIYKDPCAAENVGAPEPQNIPRLAVDENLIPEVEAPAAGGAVEVCRLNCPVVEMVEPAVIAPDSVDAPVTDNVLVSERALLIAPAVTDMP